MKKNSICKLTSCGKNYDDSEVARIYGMESMPYVLGYCSARCYTKSKNPYDIHQKGLKFDASKKEHEALKKRNVELVEALEELNGLKPRHPSHPDSKFNDRAIYNKAYKKWMKINKLAQTNNSND